METCKSPRMVMRSAFELGSRIYDDYSCKFSRKDFTRPQLFACLVLREHQKKSYRGVEALLRDCSDLREEIGLTRVPDHNTLCRAFRDLIKSKSMNKALDLQVAQANERGILAGDKVKPAALDSTHFESRHVSRHFEKRQNQTARQERAKLSKNKQKEAINRDISKTIKGLPKLSIAVATACHLILAMRATTGGGSDHPHFSPLMFDAWRRADMKVAVADAGFDSESNHRIGRLDMGVKTIIPPRIGRPTAKLPSTPFRREMHRRFKREADKATYGQRWQVETVNSMIKRNLGSALRARTAKRRSMELLLRVVTHNIMILEGREP